MRLPPNSDDFKRLVEVLIGIGLEAQSYTENELSFYMDLEHGLFTYQFLCPLAPTDDNMVEVSYRFERFPNNQHLYKKIADLRTTIVAMATFMQAHGLQALRGEIDRMWPDVRDSSEIIDLEVEKVS